MRRPREGVPRRPKSLDDGSIFNRAVAGTRWYSGGLPAACHSNHIFDCNGPRAARSEAFHERVGSVERPAGQALNALEARRALLRECAAAFLVVLAGVGKIGEVPRLIHQCGFGAVGEGT